MSTNIMLVFSRHSNTNPNEHTEASTQDVMNRYRPSVQRLYGIAVSSGVLAGDRHNEDMPGMMACMPSCMHKQKAAHQQTHLANFYSCTCTLFGASFVARESCNLTCCT